MFFKVLMYIVTMVEEIYYYQKNRVVIVRLSMVF